MGVKKVLQPPPPPKKKEKKKKTVFCIFSEHGEMAICWHPGEIYGDRPMGTLPSWELNTIGISEYSDFGHIERYISETVQDRR